jgi:peptidoglycan/LPS O-acetylase OafA/YrhL
MLAVATVSRAVIAYLALPHPAMWCITFSRLDPIALGILAVPVSRRIAGKLGSGTRIGAFAGGGLLLATLMRFSDVEGGWHGLVVYPLAAVASFLPVVAIMPGPSGRSIFALLRRAPVVFLGRISYGLYVFHILAFVITSKILERLHIEDGYFQRALPALAVDVAIGIVSYRVLERPFLSLKTRFAFVESRPGG